MPLIKQHSEYKGIVDARDAFMHDVWDFLSIHSSTEYILRNIMFIIYNMSIYAHSVQAYQHM